MTTPIVTGRGLWRTAYVSGPILGQEYPGAVFHVAVEEARRQYRLEFDEFVNPLTIPNDCGGRCTSEVGVSNPLIEGHSYLCYLRYDVARLVLCNAIIMVPGWQGSRGARLEMSIATQLGLDVMILDPGMFQIKLNQHIDNITKEVYHG